MILYIDNLVIFIVFHLHIIVLNPIFFFSANFGIVTYSEAGFWEHHVEGYTEQQNPRDRVELVCDNNFDTLSKHDKYIVLEYRFVPEAKFDFPKTIKHGCNRSCKRAYLSDSSFLYSCQDNSCLLYLLRVIFPQRQTQHIGCICYILGAFEDTVNGTI